MIDWVEANIEFFDSRVWTTLQVDGRPVLKYPTDLWVYEEIIRRTQPEVIVETGSYEGGSALWFSRFAPVISVDVRSPRAALPGVGVIWLEGDSVALAGEVAALVDGRRCLVSLDSDHHAAHVLAELQAYSPLATEYLVVEDTAVDAYGIEAWLYYPDGGPGAAVEDWLVLNPGWAADHECERFKLGMNPGGWLRRA